MTESMHDRARVIKAYGTRPEAIIAAPVIKTPEAIDTLQPVTVVAAQPREMVDQINAVLGIVPKMDLSLLPPGQTLNGTATRVIGGMNAV